MKCIYCNCDVPLPDRWGEPTYCTGCERPYIGETRDEVWFDIWWEQYKAVENKND